MIRHLIFVSVTSSHTFSQIFTPILTKLNQNLLDPEKTQKKKYIRNRDKFWKKGYLRRVGGLKIAQELNGDVSIKTNKKIDKRKNNEK